MSALQPDGISTSDSIVGALGQVAASREHAPHAARDEPAPEREPDPGPACRRVPSGAAEHLQERVRRVAERPLLHSNEMDLALQLELLHRDLFQDSLSEILLDA